jgi:hypothetical protein
MPNTPELLFELAEALGETGQNCEAAHVFRQAFLLDPGAFSFPRNATRAGAASELVHMREWVRSLIEQGAIFPPLIAVLAIAEALLGNDAGVRRLIDYDRFFKCQTVPSPEGFQESGFHSALAAEIRSDLRFYDLAERRSIRNGWCNNHITTSVLPASHALTRTLRNHVDRYIAALPEDSDHPFVASRPSQYLLEGWAVVTNGLSHHESHMHPRAWLSGVYYVVRPPASIEAHTDRGWLHVGPPGWIGDLAGWDTRLVEPAPGNLVLMPGYFFHHTQPMGVNEERICVAFDVLPGEVAAANPHTQLHRSGCLPE